jgi:hypothetical protein
LPEGTEISERKVDYYNPVFGDRSAIDVEHIKNQQTAIQTLVESDISALVAYERGGAFSADQIAHKIGLKRQKQGKTPLIHITFTKSLNKEGLYVKSKDHEKIIKGMAELHRIGLRKIAVIETEFSGSSVANLVNKVTEVPYFRKISTNDWLKSGQNGEIRQQKPNDELIMLTLKAPPQGPWWPLAGDFNLRDCKKKRWKFMSEKKSFLET